MLLERWLSFYYSRKNSKSKYFEETTSTFSHCNIVLRLYSKEEHHIQTLVPEHDKWIVQSILNLMILSALLVLIYWVQRSMLYNDFCPLGLHLIYRHVSYWKHFFKIYARLNSSFEWLFFPGIKEKQCWYYLFCFILWSNPLQWHYKEQ